MNERPTADPVPDLTDRQAEIVAAATEVFGERGYSGGSMREIATRVGVSEPALYRHFPGKRELFITMVRVAGTRARSEGLALIDGFTAANVHTRLVEALEDRRRAAALYAPVLRAVLNAAASEPAIVEEFRSVVARPMIAALTAKAAELDASFETADAEATRDARVRALLALLVGTMASSFVLGDRPDAAVADAALRIMGWDATPR